jgi:hypothetical protein
LRLAFCVPSFMALGVLPLSRRFVLPTTASLFAAACVPLLRLRLGALPLPLRLTALLPTASALLFATTRRARRFAATVALLFVTTPAVGLFVAAAPLFSAFCPLMGMTPPAPLLPGFRVSAGDWDVGQRKRTAHGDRAALSASVS